MVLVPNVYSIYKAGLLAILENHPILENTLTLLLENLLLFSLGISKSVVLLGTLNIVIKPSLEAAQDIPLSIQLEMEMGYWTFRKKNWTSE